MVLAHAMAFESEMVIAEMIEAMEFPELSNAFGVSGVPHTAINGGAEELVGAGPEEQLVEVIGQLLENS